MNIPWVEKYRPKIFSEIVGNKHIISRFEIIAKGGNLPNLIICGSSGTGKTISVDVLARSLLGDCYRDAVLEISASDYRGVEFVRNTVKTFAKKKLTLPPGIHKIIIIEEAESIPNEAQQVLRRIMEFYSGTTRFIFSCNTSAKIIEPIQSRCAIVRFSNLDGDSIRERILHICKKECVNYTKDGIDAIVFTSDGDMRNAIGNIQSTYTGMGVVTHDNVFRLCDIPKPEVVLGILENCVKKKFVVSMLAVKSMNKEGHSSQDITNTFFKVCKNRLDVEESTRMKFLKEIAFTHSRVTNGLISSIQLVGMCSRLCDV